MSDSAMPELITERDNKHRPVEYIRADVAAAQLDAANKRIAELEHMRDLSTESLQWSQVRIAELEVALCELCDLQNGPPLVRDADRWQQTMDTARKLLKGQPE